MGSENQFGCDLGEYYRTYSQLHKHKHPFWYLAFYARRQARLEHVYSDLEVGDVEFLYGLQEGCCAYCGQPDKEDGLRFNVEHPIPIRQGGVNTLGNAVLSCHSCNSQKGSRTADRWIQRLQSLQPERALIIQTRFRLVRAKLALELEVR